MGQFGEDLHVRRDDQLSVIGCERLTQVKALSARHEQHLVGVANDIVIGNVPDK